jgi:hypothetical protein
LKPPGAETTMPACAGTTKNKNQLLRVCDTPAAETMQGTEKENGGRKGVQYSN